ncbi:hypothetical protein GWO43_15465, partial [candidate division KSB1 bacterium]|nr:hypothetical protein [Gammaproteobacteria bacterium]NIR49911.1 hypothetical protein [candidate division KSB1 bacterium]NIV68626.1 hypothetical protein [Phycisphaerae bacterium]NIT72244.1 hypothetical protein [candidate division KSB1 bacterium]NIU26053.1 hypothetical protein [candidate division KSB1 bacterium]
MSISRRLLFIAVLLLGVCGIIPELSSQQQQVNVITLEGVISPVTADYMDYEISQAVEDGA